MSSPRILSMSGELGYRSPSGTRRRFASVAGRGGLELGVLGFEEKART
jgi:hypothetical protein